MIKRGRGRPKKLDPIRGEDVGNTNSGSTVRSVFDEFDNGVSGGVGSFVDTMVEDVSMRVDNPSGVAPMVQSAVGNQQALLSETVIDVVVDKVIKRLTERDNYGGQQPPSDTVVVDGSMLLADRRSSVLGCLTQNGQASSDALHHIVNAESAHQYRLLQMEQTTCHRDFEYNQLELNRAKAVIAEVMGMHAAVPFNTPVDPLALGIPDYFEVVDTPMDFGTIYNNIEKGVKYQNSEDVLKDVEYIWKSCRQYYSKGDHIMDLMELVKKNFVKYWSEAGLHNNTVRSGAGYFTMTSSVSAPNGVGTEAPAQPTKNNTLQIQQNALCQQQPLQSHSRGQLDQPDDRQHDLSVSWDNLQTDCPDSAMMQSQQGQDHVDLAACAISDHLNDKSIVECHPESENYDDAYYPCSIGEEDSHDQHLANIDMSCPDPTIDSLDDQLEAEAMIDSNLLGNSSPNSSRNNEHQPSFDAVQPYLVQSDGDAVSSAFSSSKKRRTRGPTKCLYVWSRSDDKGITVPINNLGEPIGPNASKLSNFLGTIARDGKLVPLSYITWKKVPANIQENIWQLVQSKFVVDPEIRGWVFRNLATKFANWKAQLKAKHYNPHQTDEERLADCDKRVLLDQWQDLINFWNSEESQKQSERNKANRAKVKFCHTSGTKSFARLCEEQQAKNGKEPTKAELFILTHSRKDGQPVNESSSMAISKLREKLAPLPETVQSDQCDDEILYETIGQNKRHRTRVSRRAETIKIASEIKRAADEEVSLMRQKMELMEQKYNHMESLMNKVLSNIDPCSSNEQVGMPVNLTIEESVDPESPIDIVPAEQVPASAEVPRKRLTAT